MKVERLATDGLIPYARNAKKHDDAQVAQIAASIREFGFNNPVLIDQDNGIIAGHGRVLAARKLGLAEVPCIRLGHLTDTQRRAYIIADNRLTETGGGWDTELLALELEDLRLDDFDLDLTGFEAAALEEILGDGMGDAGSDLPEDTEPEIDRAEELRQKWGVETGQLWQLGEHRLLCGDSTRAEDVARVMGGEKAVMVFTDPPYGIAFDGSNRPKKHSRQYEEILVNDGRSNLDAFVNQALSAIDSMLLPGGVAYVCTAIVVYADWVKPFEERFKLRATPVWVKDNPAAGRSDFFWGYEPILYGSKEPGKRIWNGGRGQSDVWQFRNVNSFGYIKDDGTRNAKNDAQQHPTQKPLDLVDHAIKLSSNPGCVVGEPFSGSGTTLIACENLKRRCRAIEISPAYCAVALERWHQHAGQTPVLMA